MKIEHEGFSITEMIGGFTAEVRDGGGYVEIMIHTPNANRTFDLGDLESLIQELRGIAAYARAMTSVNQEFWDLSKENE